jgi:hypothetical protein
MPDESAPDEERAKQDSAEAAQPDNPENPAPLRSAANAPEEANQLVPPALSPYQARHPASPYAEDRSITSPEISELHETSRINWFMLGGLGLLLVVVLIISLGYVEGWLDELGTLLLAGLVFALLVVIFFLFNRRRYHRP